MGAAGNKKPKKSKNKKDVPSYLVEEMTKYAYGKTEEGKYQKPLFFVMVII